MPCNCGRRSRGLTPDSRFIPKANPKVVDDLVSLQGFEDCTTNYAGPFRSATIIIVAWGKPQEKLYKRGDRTEAIKFAKDNKLSFDVVAAGSLCNEPVLALLGS